MDKAQGRTISVSIHVRLTPPTGGDVGETDAATAIGLGLVREVLRLLKNAGEAEGFMVEISARQVVY